MYMKTSPNVCTRNANTPAAWNVQTYLASVGRGSGSSFSEPSAPVASVPATPRPVSQASRLARLSDDEPLIRLAEEAVEPRIRRREEPE